MQLSDSNEFNTLLVYSLIATAYQRVWSVKLIANTLIMPTESPVSTRDIKRALISFDQVYIPSPDDRDMIPQNTFMSVASAVPFAVTLGNQPVRLLGKVPGFDDETQRSLDDMSEAIKQGTVVLMNAPEYEKDL